MKRLRKVLLYFLSTVVILVVSFSLSVYLFKDRIIRQFIREANKSLSTPVKIGKIDISSWRDFPNLAIVFTDVYVEDSQEGEYPLLTASTISFYLNPIEVWNGNYSIRGLQIEDSETNLKIDENGTNNYTILKDSAGTDSVSSISFDLRNVRLLNTKVDYHDIRSRLHHVFQSEKLMASISVHGDLYDIDADGDITTGQIGTGNNVLLKNKTFRVNARLVYDDGKKNIDIQPSTIRIDKSVFDVKGAYSFADRNYIDLTAKGKNTNIQALLSLMPEGFSKKVSKYQSDGNVYFDLLLKGEVGRQRSPSISIAFGCKDTRVYHPEYKSTVTHANMEGSFASPSLGDFSRAELYLKGITGELNDKKFQADFSIENFDDPLVSLDFKGALDAASLLHFYPVPDIHQLEGGIQADISFSGRLSNLRKKATAQQVTTHGSIEMENIQITAGARNIHVKNLNGSLQFNRNDLALSDVRGQFENSDFRLNGFLKNVITWFLFENQPIGIETDLQSDFLDLDQLLTIGYGASGTDSTHLDSHDFRFSISPNLHLNFNCDIKSMRYRRFAPRHVKGDLLVKNQMAVSRKITFDGMGGSVSLNGIVDAKDPKAIDVVTSFTLDGIHVDSLFYVFENFRQDFIEDKHLKGEAFAEVSMDMTLNESLRLYPETLVTDISVLIRRGELNDFAPMQKLNKYLDDEGLNHLRFGDLKNDVHIEKRTIYIPSMEIGTNLTAIRLSGTHTFDQQINYRVVAPLRNKKKIDPDEAFGAIEELETGKPKIFLKITGTTDKYDVSYDADAVKKKVVNDFKKEVNELKDAFKLKGKKKKKELELEKDEYFEWEK